MAHLLQSVMTWSDEPSCDVNIYKSRTLLTFLLPEVQKFNRNRIRNFICKIYRVTDNNHIKVHFTGFQLNGNTQRFVGDAVAWLLACWAPDREVRVQALAESLCCVLGQDTLLSWCLRTQFPEILTQCWGGGGGVTCDGPPSHPGGVAIHLKVASCYRNWTKLRQ